MNQFEFICRQLSRATPKTFEHYIITRIWHSLNDTELKFVTQQHITRPDGRALTDMYFPQLKIHIEVDEGHHKNQVISDTMREADIINATGHTVLRVDATQDLERVHHSIYAIVTEIKKAKESQKDFKAWDFEAEQNPETYLQRGYIDVEDDVAFRTMVDAANCFGHSYKAKSIWKGAVPHAMEQDKILWFPKLYKNAEWDNTISNDEKTITEKCLDVEEAERHIIEAQSEKNAKLTRLVFARVKSSLGDVMYRFKGEYKLDVEKTNFANGVIYERTSTRVKTYRAKTNE